MSAVAETTPRKPDVYKLDESASGAFAGKVFIVTAIAAIALAIGWIADGSTGKKQFYFSYLWGYVWALNVTLGCLFWNLIHHVTAAGWSVGMRRIFENVTRALPVLLVMFIPIAIGMDSIYKWTHAEDLKNGKEVWLSKPFFFARILIYFSIWIVYSRMMRNLSIKMDHSDSFEERKAILRKLEWWAPSGVALLGLTATFAAFDLIMSLNYAWYSTIFGVIFWADGIRGSMASCLLIVLGFRTAGYLKHTITREHMHDIGKLMFGFTVFWTYVSFSQYFLYWYGNISEETKFYNDRRVGSWYAMSVLLPIIYFAVPFITLLPRGNKRNPKIIGFVAAWVLGCQMYHQYWEIMPESLKTTVHDLPVSGIAFNWTDLASIIMFGGVLLSCLLSGMRKEAIVPIRDPRFGESVHHEVDEFGDPD